MTRLYRVASVALIGLVAAPVAAGADENSDPRLRAWVATGAESMTVKAHSYHCLPGDQPDDPLLCIDGGVLIRPWRGRRLDTSPGRRIRVRLGHPGRRLTWFFQSARSRQLGPVCGSRQTGPRRFVFRIPRHVPSRADRIVMNVTHEDGNGGQFMFGISH